MVGTGYQGVAVKIKMSRVGNDFLF
jgi:hypothetical protein